VKHTNLTSAFPVAIVVAVKASLRLDGHRAPSGQIDATAVADDMLRRRPDLDPALVATAVASRLSEDPLHCLA
jgi:hypothetical protein